MHQKYQDDLKEILRQIDAIFQAFYQNNQNLGFTEIEKITEFVKCQLAQCQKKTPNTKDNKGE